ncbi:SAM-dependent methyltransferase [Ruegeria arenilitoris]|uniref:SAM-dependent methyltransferase n=1 Tax=Ruegeria arenilitoris TaxID=1173585 RepID=UPI00147DD57F|nr:SAM-dependent methyltransferase [Ruegeria arenilitoris]
MTFDLTFIGHIETPYQSLDECPNNIQADGPLCAIVLDPRFAEGLLGLEAGQTILVLYWLEGVDRNLLVQRRGGRCEESPRGVFALRSPHRPNPIATARVQIEAITNGRITVRGMDCLNGTKLIDIKLDTK